MFFYLIETNNLGLKQVLAVLPEDKKNVVRGEIKKQFEIAPKLFCMM